MKKILFLLVFVLSSHSIANAQIKIQESFTNDLIYIGGIEAGGIINSVTNKGYELLPAHKVYCRIFKDKTTYGLLLDAPNMYEDDFEFALGTNIKEAKESIELIIKFMKENPLKTSMVVDDEDGRKVQLNLITKKILYLNVIDAKGDFIFNEIPLHLPNLEKALKLLDEKAEERVNKELSKR